MHARGRGRGGSGGGGQGSWTQWARLMTAGSGIRRVSRLLSKVVFVNLTDFAFAYSFFLFCLWPLFLSLNELVPSQLVLSQLSSFLIPS